jgi:hypothetical protein
MKIIESRWTLTSGAPAFLMEEAHSLSEFIFKVRRAIKDDRDVTIYREDGESLIRECEIEVDHIAEIGKVVCFDRVATV